MKTVNLEDHKISSFLDQTFWASDLKWPEIERLSMYFKAYKAQKGEYILEEGEAGKFMGLIIEGEVEIIKQSGDKNNRLALLKQSNTFGELSLLDGGKCSASAIAHSDVILLLTTKKDLFLLAENYPVLAVKVMWKIANQISKRLRKTTGQLVDFI